MYNFQFYLNLKTKQKLFEKNKFKKNVHMVILFRGEKGKRRRVKVIDREGLYNKGGEVKEKIISRGKVHDSLCLSFSFPLSPSAH